MYKWLLSLVVLAGLGVSASEAQVIINPYSSPFGGQGGIFGPGLGGNSLFGQGIGGPNSLYGYPGSRPGFYGPQATGQLNGQLTGQSGPLVLDPNSTGHPTRFNSSARYFFNQGGAFLTTTPITNPTVGNGLIGRGTRNTPGVRPPQGQDNLTQP